jgi:hypothetical protein
MPTRGTTSSTTAPIDDSGDFPILRLAVSPGDRILVFHDVHFPIHDPAAMDVVVEAAQVLGCTTAIADGDIFDYNAVSKHRKSAVQAIQYGSLAAEGESGREAMQAIRAAVPHCIYKRGNHEERLDRVVDDNPGLLGAMEWWTPIADAVDGWDCLPGDPIIKAGPVSVFHGHELSGSISANPARAVLSRYPGQNTVAGHNHQVDSATTPTMRDGKQVVHGCWFGGHLSDPRKQDYAIAFKHRWQQALTVVEYWEMNEDQDAWITGGRPKLGFTVHQARIFRDWRGMPVARVLGKTLRGN